MRKPVLLTLEVGGEQFAIRQGKHGGTDYDWVSGPNSGYGFSSSAAAEQPIEEHRKSIEDFLAAVDPVTGYIEGCSAEES